MSKYLLGGTTIGHQTLIDDSMEKTNLPYDKHSILFAPMEGVTDPIYRKTVMELFPEWDMFATDFLRVPTEGTVTHKRVLEHFGEEIYKDKELRKKQPFKFLPLLVQIRHKQSK